MAYRANQQERITLNGASGAKYEFEVYPWGTEFRPTGGVYAVLRRDPGGYRVLYVGETGDLSERFDNHHRALCFTLHRKTHIGVLAEGSRDRRLAIETDIRQFYNPPCNQQ